MRRTQGLTLAIAAGLYLAACQAEPAEEATRACGARVS